MGEATRTIESRLRQQEAPTLSADPFDSFNDDLVWILDKLVDRAGGSFGVLVGRVATEPANAILARSSDFPELTPGALAMLSSVPALASERRVPNDHTPEVTIHRLSSADTGEAEDLKVLLLTLSPAPGVLLCACVCRTTGFEILSGLHEAAAVRLYPVLSRYLRLWWMHRQERRRASSLSAALDLSDVGVLLLDRRGELLFANGRAESVLRRGQGLRVQERALVTEQSAERARLYALVQDAIYRNRSLGANGEHVATLAVPRAGQQRPLILTITSVQRAAVDSNDAAVIVYLLDPDQDLEAVLDPACSIYSLTAAETRLVYHLVGGARLSDAAQRMQIKLETARAYLKQIFSKTGTHRQAELMRVMLSSAVRMTGRAVPDLY